MDTRRFGRKIKMPSTFAIKHQIRRLMMEDGNKELEAESADPAEGITTHLAVKPSETKGQAAADESRF